MTAAEALTVLSRIYDAAKWWPVLALGGVVESREGRTARRIGAAGGSVRRDVGPARRDDRDDAEREDEPRWRLPDP